MRKFLNCFIGALVIVFSVFGLTACSGQKDEGTVNLVSVEANNVGLMSDVDYYVVAEPAASAKVKAISGLNFVGDLQKLYGGENGYPQAVVVAKNSLIGTNRLNDFVDALSSSGDWLVSGGASIDAIVNAIQSHLTKGMESAIKTKNLTYGVIKNCGVKFVSATESKAEIISFMEKFNAISENSFGLSADEFFWDGAAGTGEYMDKISVYAPDGAPALGLAKLMSENIIANTEYEIVNANMVQALVGGAQPEADVCVLPVNLAIKMLGNAKNYKLIGTLTHGNLYLLSKDTAQIDRNNIKNLKGKSVGVVNLAAVPGLTFKLILKNCGIEYSEPNND